MEEKEKYSYIEISLLVGILLASKTVDFIVTGCSSGQGMMLACNSMPGVICGYAPTPKDAQYDAIENMKSYGCMPQAWGPLAEGKHGVFTHPVLTEIGEKYGKTAAQIALKWNAQRGVSIIPKSVHKERMEQNIDIWDFTLSDEDMKKVDALDLGHSEIIDHTDPNVVKYILSAKADS